MKGMVFFLLWAVLAFLPCRLHGQMEYNNWYFGLNSGVTFSSGIPGPLYDGALRSDEGVASISDKNGNLLFYSNGSEVFNRQHQLMPNGSNLTGHISSSQSCLIVKSLKDDSIYYLFTVPAQLGAWPGATGPAFCYSVVDMRLQNTLGDISQKNIFLLDSVCEKITAVRHADKKSVWVVVHKWNSNQFYSFPVTCSGIGAPVISSCGSVMTDDITANYFPAIGCMKLSRNGKKIAYTWNFFPGMIKADAFLELADFDNATGMVSNAETIIHSDTNLDPRGYGVEFSPNSSLLYFSESGLDNGIGYSKLYQYDLNAPDLELSEVMVASTFKPMGSLQCGPDNKIYIARLNGSKNISILHNPDVTGTGCNFDDAGIDLTPNYSTWGLPNNWDEFPPEEEYEIFSFDDTLFCSSDNVVLDAAYEFPQQVLSYLWNNGSTDPVIQPDHDGIYMVKIFLQCDTISDSVNVFISHPVIDLGADTSLCQGDEKLIGTTDTFMVYSWNNNEITPWISVKDTGLYILSVLDSNGCPAVDSVYLNRNGCGCSVFVPKAFSDNNDAVNDRFSIYSDCTFNYFSLIIFNRWGQPVFITDDPSFQWQGDGSRSGQNVYAYVLNYKTWENKSLRTRRGSIVVIK